MLWRASATALSLLLATPCVNAYAPSFIPTGRKSALSNRFHRVNEKTFTRLFSSMADEAPSDYDSSDLEPSEKSVAVDTKDEDAVIRDELKRELLLLASTTDRGQYATPEERDIIVDLVTQLEALNPTANPAGNCEGEWDLCLTDTQSFRTSPFFMSIRAAFGDENKAIAENGFRIHNRATSASRVGRVRQTILKDELVSEVDLEVGLMPGLPVKVKGTVVTNAGMDIIAPETWEVSVKGTKVKGSNVPFLDQYLDDFPLEIGWGDIYSKIAGTVPIAVLKTFYVDEGIRITRDMDDNYFVFSRA